MRVGCPILAPGVPSLFPPNISGDCGLMESTGCGFMQHERPSMCSSLAPSSIGTIEMGASTSTILNTSIPPDQRLPSVMQVDLPLMGEGLLSSLPPNRCGDQCVLQSGCSAVVHPSIPSSVPNTFVTPNISLFASTFNVPSIFVLSTVEM